MSAYTDDYIIYTSIQSTILETDSATGLVENNYGYSLLR